MKRVSLVLLIALLGTGTPPGLVPAGAAATTTTWTLVESPDVHLRWPNQFNSANPFESDGGLLGRIVSHTDETSANTCELAESHPCAQGEPPAVLGAFPGGVEGPPAMGGFTECNRKTIACSEGAMPPAAHSGHPGDQTPDETPIGEFSYFVARRVSGERTMAFISGDYTVEEGALGCNGCPPDGAGRDIDNAGALSNGRNIAPVQTLDVSLWTTQFVDGLSETGHARVILASAGAGAGSGCGNGTVHENLLMDICIDDPYPIPVRWKFRTYSVDQGQHASPANPGRCDGPDCYVRNVIVPAALAQSGQAAKNVQVRQATAIVPSSPNADSFGMTGATIDLILFAYTTQMIDRDGDGIENRVDPCPNDPTDFCTMNLVGGGACPAGQVFCADAFGTLGCLDAFLCNERIDPNQDCAVDAADFSAVAGEDDGMTTGLEAFGTGAPIGPYEP